MFEIVTMRAHSIPAIQGALADAVFGGPTWVGRQTSPSPSPPLVYDPGYRDPPCTRHTIALVCTRARLINAYSFRGKHGGLYQGLRLMRWSGQELQRRSCATYDDSLPSSLATFVWTCSRWKNHCVGKNTWNRVRGSVRASLSSS